MQVETKNINKNRGGADNDLILKGKKYQLIS